jgi:hypothetical protein
MKIKKHSVSYIQLRNTMLIHSYSIVVDKSDWLTICNLIVIFLKQRYTYSSLFIIIRKFF